MFFKRFSLRVLGIQRCFESDFEVNERGRNKLEESMIRAGTSGRPSMGDFMAEADQIVRKRESANRICARAIDAALRDPENPFKILIDAFQKIILKEFTGKVGEYQATFYEDYRHNFLKSKARTNFMPKSVNQMCAATKDALLSIQRFIKLVMNCISYLYSPVIGSDRFYSLKEMVVNSLVDVVINTDVYTLIFMFFRMEHQAEETIIEQKIRELKTISPEHLSISPYLCLNEVSGILEIAATARKKLSSPSKDDSPSKLIEEDKAINHSRKSSKENLPQEESNIDDTLSQIPSDAELIRRVQGQPYLAAIEKLRQVAQLYTPMQKLQCIADLNSHICRCIDDFWKGVPVKREKLSIDADQYLSILVYIVVKANVSDLFTHIMLTNEFATLGSTSSYHAYCLTTLQASFYHLLNIDIGAVLRSGKGGAIRGEEHMAPGTVVENRILDDEMVERKDSL